MKKNLSILVLIFISLSVFSQEYIFKFRIDTKEEFKKLNQIVSIDHGYGIGEVVAYAGPRQFKEFLKLGYDFEFLEHPSKGKDLTMATDISQMINWNRYPTHDVYIEMMNKFAEDYPDICRIETIGNSVDGREIKVLKISDNPDVNENEPEFFYTGQMHGDEIVAYILFLRVADYLLKNYNKDQRITDLVNNTEIWINPVSNPDGTYAGGDNTVSGATRSNANFEDLNRSFPNPVSVPGNTGEPEVQMMISFADNHNFVLAANGHSGIELVNYPWDTWESNEKTHADNDWFDFISYNYANTVHDNAPSSYFQGQGDGVTHGGDWYVALGTRQDYMTYYKNCREVTLEFSNSKMLDVNLLPAHWDYNKDAMIGYIEETLTGIRGIVTDGSGNNINAIVSISGHDYDNSEVISESETGNYHRMIENGTYNLTFSADGYSDVVVNNVNVVTGEITILDVELSGSAGSTDLNGIITNNDSGELLSDTEIIITGENENYTVTTNDNGEYSVSNITSGTYKFEMSKDGFMSAVHFETVSETQNNINKALVPYITVSGTVIEAVTGEFIENAEVEILSSSIEPEQTNENGIFNISGIVSGTYIFKITKSGFAPSIKEINIIDGSNYIGFQLHVSTAISFEEGIPDDFTFSGNADWTRVDDELYEGDWSMKSGNIDNSQNSVMELATTTEAGIISFYHLVSSEQSYDFLRFYVDGEKLGEWSGANNSWTEAVYDISAGGHIFKWQYEKDGSDEGGSDCAWVDYISLPAEMPESFTLTFNVTGDNSAINNANVLLFGYGNNFTNTNGEVDFTNIYGTNTPGLYYTVNAEGYNEANGNVEVTGNQTVDVSLDLISVKERNPELLNIYPNPNEGSFSIKSTQILRTIEITELTGRVIKNINVNAKNKNINNIPNGVYILTIKTDTAIYKERIVVKF